MEISLGRLLFLGIGRRFGSFKFPIIRIWIGIRQ